LLSCAGEINRQDSDSIEPIVSKQDSASVNEIPKNVDALMNAYPNLVIGFKNNMVIFSDSSELIYDDQLEKNDSVLLYHPDIEDIFTYSYPLENLESAPLGDPGRIRSEAFFGKIYGASKQEVMDNLVEIEWCPKLVGRKIRVNKRNNVAEKFQALSNELDKHPEFVEYLNKIGGTFNYRTISGTNRLSAHSYGITIDINVSKSNYWQWDCKCKNEDGVKGYRNKIPLALVKIFEKHGFIWGGKWKHYDTMHFEYRPELL
jgi:hypothetical protein